MVRPGTATAVAHRLGAHCVHDTVHRACDTVGQLGGLFSPRPARRAAARSFLHNQVRSMVGSLRLVGEGKWTPHLLRRALEAKDRAKCGPVAPPDGLYLLKVDY